MRRNVGLITAVVALGILLFEATRVVLAQPTFADQAFDRLWNQQDRAVFEQRDLNRSWTWGPENLSPRLREPYAESVDPDGQRTVQYFDKSRMEINNPQGNPNDRFYVTNGLLPIELITGRLQTGNESFVQQRPAQISAVGDPGQYPNYADLLPLLNSTAIPSQFDRPVTRVLNPDGRVADTFDQFLNNDDVVADTTLRTDPNGTGHGVAQAFLDFQNIQGLIFVNNQYITGPVFDPLFVFGLPVTEPYWVTTQVGGNELPVLFQVFERRMLTYNPANDPAFRVEMGNVGQHYYSWRYESDLEPVDPTTEPLPTDEPTDPADPTTEPADPTDEPVEPTDEPVEPTDEPVEPTDEPIEEPTPTIEPTPTEDPYPNP